VLFLSSLAKATLSWEGTKSIHLVLESSPPRGGKKGTSLLTHIIKET